MDWLLVTVSNIAPELEALPDLSITAGELLTVVGSFSDPGLQDSYSLFIDWGDGMTETQVLPAGVVDFSAEHIYAMAGSYTVSLSISDDDGGLDSQTFSVAVESPTTRTFLPFLTKE
jgi:PKD repeat protein